MEHEEPLHQHYGSVFKTMFTLFVSVTSHADWQVLLAPLLDISWALVLPFVLCAIFVYFGMLNIVTSIFLSQLRKFEEQDEEQLMQDEAAMENGLVKVMQDIFHSHDLNNSGGISMAELELMMSDTATLARLKAIQVEPTQARSLFCLLDDNMDGRVHIDEFINGMLRLRGSAKSVDMAMLLFENKKIKLRLAAFMRFAEDQFIVLQQAILGANCPKADLNRYYDREKDKRVWLRDIDEGVLGPEDTNFTAEGCLDG